MLVNAYFLPPADTATPHRKQIFMKSVIEPGVSGTVLVLQLVPEGQLVPPLSQRSWQPA